MKRVMVVLLASLCASLHSAVGPPKITGAQAKALVLAALNEEQKRLPRLGVEPYSAPGSSKFLFFTVTWAGTSEGSVVVGNYAVDPDTGDVFSAVMSCHEEDNKALRTLQTQIRSALHLSNPEYRRLKTKGPLCEE